MVAMTSKLWRQWSLGIAAGLAFVWAYATVLGQLIETWWSVADYSHGFFIIPIALYLAWSHRSSCPGNSRPAAAVGLTLLVLSLSATLFGSIAHIQPVEQYPIVPALAGLILVAGGGRLLLWAAPMVLFLLFMIPLPHSLATHLSAPLQNMGASGSAYLLQAVGVPVLVEGTTLWLENARLNVAFACSGLQMVISFGAVCTAIALLSHYPLPGKILIAASAIPIAIACNILRIALIAWAYRFELVPPKELHDAGGILIVPVTVALVFLGMYLFERSFPKRRPA
jgi:exosortase